MRAGFIVASLISLIYSTVGCSSALGLETNYTSTASLLSPTPCTAINVQSTQTPPSSKLIYFLLDRSNSFASDINLAIDLIRAIGPDAIEPGYRVIMAWVTSEDEWNGDISTTIFFNQEVPTISTPVLAPFTPDLQPTLIPDIPEDNSSTARHMVWSATATAITEINSENARKYENQNRCNAAEWQTQVQATTESYVADRETEIQTYWADLERSLSVPTLRQAAFFYESLAYASSVIHNYKMNNTYSASYIIILSDLIEWRDKSPDLLQIELSEVRIVLPMFHCQYYFECSDLVNFWTDKFNSFNASEPMFLYADVPFDEALKDILEN